jgi:hypothetical protein
MRYLIACTIGIACTAATYHTLIWALGQIGVHAHSHLPYPMERSIGRFDIGESDQDLTLAGYAIATLSIVIGSNIGAAVFYRTFKPWRTVSERATANAWWFISLFLLFSLSIFQLLSRKIHDGIPGLIVSILEFAIPACMAWGTWKWWKTASIAKEDCEA